MKKVAILLAGSLIAASLGAQASLMSQQQKLSYTLGAGLGKNLKAQSLNLDMNSFQKGLSDAYQNKQMRLSPDEMQQQAEAFRKKQMSRFKEAQTQVADDNARKGQVFLDKNKNEHNVISLPDGLQYKVVTPGTGAKPTKDSKVTVNYEGKLVNGQVFDSSYRRGKPLTFSVDSVIKGWQQAIPMMKTGATWMLFIPSKLAYGERGIPGAIPPNATLIFKVHLISVNKKQ